MFFFVTGSVISWLWGPILSTIYKIFHLSMAELLRNSFPKHTYWSFMGRSDIEYYSF